MVLTPWISEVFASFYKKFSLLSFLPCSSNSSGCSFVIWITLALAWFLISALSLRYFLLLTIPYEIQWSYISYEIISAMLSNLLWERSLIASCFSCITVKNFKKFHVMVVAREKSSVVPLNAIPTGRPASLANKAIEIPPVITIDVTRLISTNNACDCIESSLDETILPDFRELQFH